MTIRLIDLVFRRKVLLMTPLIAGVLLGILWTAVARPPAMYLSSASVWIDRPSAISGGAVTDFNPYASPAQNQTGTMNELLASKSFVVGILKDLGVTDPTAAQVADIRTHTLISPAGAHLVLVQFISPDRRVAATTVKAVIDQFTLNFAKQLKQKASQASDFYQAQLGVAKDSFDDSNAALQAYVRSHPGAASITTQNAPTAALDPEFIKLQLSQQAAKESYDKILGNYGQSQIIANSSDATSAYFSVMDQPDVPLFPVPPSKKAVLMKLAAGGFLGGVAMIALFLLLWRSDRKVRVPDDLSYLGIEIVSLPSLHAARRRRWPDSFVRIAGSLHAGISTLTPAQRLPATQSATQVDLPARMAPSQQVSE